jgi:hypothetical protein
VTVRIIHHALSVGVALLIVTPMASGQTYTLSRAFAFGSDSYTEPVPNAPGNDYTKVVQGGANFNYSSTNGYGYTDPTGLDDTPNDRGKTSCELYDQFIGAKYGENIVFRIDVPNGRGALYRPRPVR